jgi:hypothetical protein
VWKTLAAFSERPAAALVLAAAGVLVVVATSLAVPAAAEYSAPVVPAFVPLAAFGLLADRRGPTRELR